MLAILARRLLWAIPGGVVITALLFASLAGLIGSPAALMLGRDATAASIAELNARLGFDRPIPVQYLDWMAHALRGDLGRSYVTHQGVLEAVLPRLPVTLEIGLLALALATVASVGLNSVTSARNLVRPLTAMLAVIGITLPNFVLGLGLIYLFCVALDWLPSVGWSAWSGGLADHAAHIMLPVLTLSAYYYGSLTLVFRAEYDAVARRLFIRAVKAKGLSDQQVSWRHTMPNALLPVITTIGLSMGQLVGGAVVTESLFSIPGIGSLLVDSIMSRDYPVVLAIGMIVVFGVVLANAAADALYAAANPQVRLR